VSPAPAYGPPAPTWTDTATGEGASPNVRYRTTIVFAGWSFALANPSEINAAVKIGQLVAGGGVKVQHIEIFPPNGVPKDWIERGHKITDWGVRVTWTHPAGAPQPTAIDQAAAAMGYHGDRPAQAGVEGAVWAIAALVATGALAWVIVAKWTEKETTHLVDDLAGNLRQTLQEFFNPGVVVAALAAIALFMRRR